MPVADDRKWKEMQRATAAVAILLSLIVAGCGSSQPKTDPAVERRIAAEKALAEFQKRIAQEQANSPRMSLDAYDKLYEKVSREQAERAAAQAGQTPPAVTPPLAQTSTEPQMVQSDTQFTQLVRAAGYAPRTCWKDYPCFDALPEAQARQLGVDGPFVTIYKLLPNKNALIFFFAIRGLRTEEDMSAMMGGPHAAELLARLNKVNPHPENSQFVATELLGVQMGQTKVSIPMLLLEVAIANRDADPKLVNQAVTEARDIVARTAQTWK
ncbi:MAG TPA: hypothetical protein VMT51_15590 [Dongiaceae bacterium]|nr:hypothetical protein [Dongiaceae bacterium]